MAQYSDKKLEVIVKREATADKRDEIDYVRKEKAMDDSTSRKLEELYGGSKRISSDGSGKGRRWVCGTCEFVNYTSRMVCGECLAPNPRFLSAEKQRANILTAGKSKDPDMSVVMVGGRSYRMHADALRKAKWGNKQQQPANVEVTNSSTTTSNAQAAADATPMSFHTSRFPAYTEEFTTYGGDDAGEDGEAEVRYDKDQRVYKLLLTIDTRYHRYLIGSKRSKQLETERLTNTSLLFNKPGDDDEDVVTIVGPDESSVRAAHIRLDAILMECHDKVRYTHFISIPLSVVPSLRTSVTSLLSDMSAACCSEESGVHSSLFQRPERLHLTLLMLRLYTDEELMKARAILRELEAEVEKLFTKNDLITVKGLNYMNDDPSEVHVVYLEIEKDEQYNKLATVISAINNAFIDAGIALSKDVAHNEKLHATVINSKWRYPPDPSGQRVPFDATHVFKLFGNVCLGSHRLRRIDLSQLRTDKRDADEGSYVVDSSICFPQ